MSLVILSCQTPVRCDHLGISQSHREYFQRECQWKSAHQSDYLGNFIKLWSHFMCKMVRGTLIACGGCGSYFCFLDEWIFNQGEAHVHYWLSRSLGTPVLSVLRLSSTLIWLIQPSWTRAGSAMSGRDIIILLEMYIFSYNLRVLFQTWNNITSELLLLNLSDIFFHCEAQRPKVKKKECNHNFNIFIPLMQDTKRERTWGIIKVTKWGLRLAELKWDQGFDMIMW